MIFTNRKKNIFSHQKNNIYNEGKANNKAMILHQIHKHTTLFISVLVLIVMHVNVDKSGLYCKLKVLGTYRYLMKNDEENTNDMHS